MTVPVKQKPPEDGVDYNKLPRDLQEVIDDYSRAYDEWCTAQSQVDKKFSLLKEKQGKFDRLIKESFPSNLMTPIDSEYLKKIVRRARQNRTKRMRTEAAKQGSPKEEEEEEEQEEEEEEEEEQEEEDDDDDDDDKPEGRVVDIPTLGLEFPKKSWADSDFAI